MKFKELKVGINVYRLDKKKMIYDTVQVSSVGAPYYSNNGQLQRVVDMAIDGKTYVVPEDATITYAGDIAISTDKNTIAMEVQAIRANAENVVKSYSDSKDMLDKCDCVLEKLDDSIAEKRRVDKRFEAIESGLANIQDALQKLIK